MTKEEMIEEIREYCGAGRFQSHTPEEILNALHEGKRIFVLDTPTGDDDVLVGESSWEVALDVAYYHEFFEDYPREDSEGYIELLPPGWELDDVTENLLRNLELKE